jgi:hypothetical protein
VSILLDASRPTTRDVLATNTLPVIERIGTTLNFYDYAGQDPINGYDLAGTLHAGGSGIYTMKDRDFMCGVFNIDCPGRGASINFSEFESSIVNSPCVRGAFVASLATGPEDALSGCLVTSILASAKHDPHPLVRDAAGVYDFISNIRDDAKIGFKAGANIVKAAARAKKLRLP